MYLLNGLLNVRVVEAKELTNGNSIGKKSYVKLTVDGALRSKMKTRSVKKTLQPAYGQSVQLPVQDATSLSVTVMDRDKFREDVCGRGCFNLAILKDRQVHSDIIVDLLPQGSVTLHIEYVPTSSLFGQSLNLTILRDRESVPIIVQKCCNEVEARGLDEVGIYRICGSATAIRQLRNGFSTDAISTSITDTDIFVITSLLKLYLHELPEPVITNELYSTWMTLTTNIGVDDEAALRVVKSTMKLLPVANREVLAYLMDHLSMVAGYADSNMMGPVNLGVVFGPTMCTPSDPDIMVDLAGQNKLVTFLLQHWPVNDNSIETMITFNCRKAPIRRKRGNNNIDISRREKVSESSLIDVMFSRFSNGLNDLIKSEDFDSMCACLGVSPDTPAVASILQNAANDDDQTYLSFADFENVMKIADNVYSCIDEIRPNRLTLYEGNNEPAVLFQKYRNEDGDITATSLLKICTDNDCVISEDDACLIILSIDRSGSGRVCYNDFKSWWCPGGIEYLRNFSDNRRQMLRKAFEHFKWFDRDDICMLVLDEFSLLFANLRSNYYPLDSIFIEKSASDCFLALLHCDIYRSGDIKAAFTESTSSQNNDLATISFVAYIDFLLEIARSTINSE